MLYVLVLTVHVIVSLFLILVVLLQSGRSGDIASAFGGAGTQTVFGPRGTGTVLSRATTISAAVFMVTSFLLVILGQGARGGSVVKDAGGAATQPLPTQSAPGPRPPAAPAPAPAQGAPAPATPAPGAPTPAQPNPPAPAGRSRW